MILVDYSQIALSGIFQFEYDMKHGSDEKVKSLIRHVVLTSLLKNKEKFGKKYGELIICCDGKNYWRKQYFEHYKANRKKNRDKSDLNWKLIFDTISMIRDELEETFPYKVLCHDKAEADDIMGILTKYSQDNELVEEGLVTEPQPILLLTSDQDNIQLHKYSNVTQYSPMQKKFVKPKLSPQKDFIEKICTGDTGDGIPNIMSPDDVFVTEGTRQKSFMKKRLDEFFQKGIDACQNELEKRNYQRNELLISYEMIPQDIQDDILKLYLNTNPKGTKSDIMSYFIKHRCRLLMEDIEKF